MAYFYRALPEPGLRSAPVVAERVPLAPMLIVVVDVIINDGLNLEEIRANAKSSLIWSFMWPKKLFCGALFQQLPRRDMD